MKVDRLVLLLIGFSVFAWAPLLTGSYFSKAHDAAHTLIFVSSFDQSLRDGAFLPRWAPDLALGYGYPLFVVYNPLNVAISTLFVLAGLGLVGAVKAVYLLGLIASGLAMYLFARSLFGRPAGLIAGLLYIYAPYHLADVYVRSAAAEALAFVWPPLVLWASYRLADLRRRPGGYLLAGAVSFAALILTHTGTTFAFGLLLVPWWLFLLARQPWKDRLWLLARAGAMGALALLLSAAYWLPLLAELRYAEPAQWTVYNFAEHHVYFFQLFSPFWGYGYSSLGTADGFPFQMGIAAFVLAVLALGRLRTLTYRAEAIFFAGASVVVMLAMMAIAMPVWQLFGAAGALLQFPWRLLGLLALTTAMLGGAAASHWLPLPAGEHYDGRYDWTAAGVLAPVLLLILIASQSYVFPQSTPITPAEVSPRAAIDFELAVANRTAVTIWATAVPKTSPLVAQYQAGEPLQKFQAADPAARITMRHHGGSSDVAWIETPRPTQVTLLTYDFPGWTVYIDGQPVPHGRTEPYALITFEVPAGQHEIAARFQHTPPRLLGELLSLAGLLISAGMAIALWRRRRSAEKTRPAHAPAGC